jgi:hypothetical protein
MSRKKMNYQHIRVKKSLKDINKDDFKQIKMIDIIKKNL